MAADIVGQRTFFGREVSALKLDLPGMGVVDYDVPDGENEELRNGDRIRVTVEAVVTRVSGFEKHNSDGVGVDSLKQIAAVKFIIPECVNLDAVLRRDDLEAQWQQKVG